MHIFVAIFNYVAMHIFVDIFNYVAMHTFVIINRSLVVISQHMDTGKIGAIVSANLFSFNPEFTRPTW